MDTVSRGGSKIASPEFVIRPYRASDAQQLAAVCVRTAAAGQDATGLYSSDELMPDIFATPYVEFAPEWAFVVDDGERMVGYILCAPDTRRFVDWYREVWLPRFAEKYVHVDPPVSADEHIRHLGFWPERMLVPEIDAYPAHLHIDLLPEAQGRGMGRALIDTLVTTLRAAGVSGLHLTMDPANTSARAFYDTLGFEPLPSSTEQAPTLGMQV